MANKIDLIRQAFPHAEDMIYMNHAAVAPLSKPVKEAIEAYVGERHHTNIENYFDFQHIIDATLEQIGRLVGASSRNIAFVPNTSYGLNILAQGLDWQPGDRVVIPTCEFPANVYPFMNLSARGVAVDLVQDHEGVFTVEDIEKALTPRTRLVTISWVQFLSGFRADVEKISALCKARGILLCVDAIQGMGALKMDVEALGIDFLATGGHKWLMATQGIGFVYVAPALLDSLHPAMAGWLHGPIDWERLTDFELAFHEDARKFRLGTLNAIGIAALHASLALYFEAGADWCEARTLENAAFMKASLLRAGISCYGDIHSSNQSGIVTIRHQNADGLFAYLQNNKIYGAVRNGLLRFAPAFYNTRGEVETVVSAIAGFRD